MRIIVWKDKHGDCYYDASSLEAWDASSIEILKSLTDETYGYMNPEYAAPYITDEQQKLADTNLDGLPAEVLALIEKKVLRARAHIAEENKAYEAAKKEYELAKTYVAEGKSPVMVRGKGTQWEKKIPAAWIIIEKRSGHEYEDFSLETVFTINDKDD